MIPVNHQPLAVKCYPSSLNFKSMTPTKELSTEIRTTMSEFEELITSFSEEEINQVPYADSWTAGQLAHHVLMSQEGIIKALNGRTAEAGRQPDQFVETLRNIFLDYSKKLKSPEFINPGAGPYDKAAILERIRQANKGINDAVENLDLDQLCVSFELPNLGKMTRLAWT
jgi:hypothetical protein